MEDIGMRIAALFLLFSDALVAGPTAMLAGRVTDPAGAVIPGAEVQVVNVETGIKSSTSTNEEGLFRVYDLQPGNYRILIARHGFKNIIKSGVELHVQDIIAINFEMQIGSASESITVEEGAPLIQAETATVEQIIDRNIIAELPTLTRNPYDFVGLSAGTVPSLNHGQDASHPGVGVNYAINGQRPESANFLLDGSDNVNPDTSTPAQTVPNDAIREYRVMTNGFSAEYGRNAGFVANLVTKGGTNEVHDSAHDYWRNSLLARNSFENNSRGFPRAVFNRHQPGATLGGPIVRDRAFFFGSFESTVVRSSDSRTFFVPSPELLSNSAPATQAIFRKYPVSGKPTGAPPVM